MTLFTTERVNFSTLLLNLCLKHRKSLLSFHIRIQKLITSLCNKCCWHCWTALHINEALRYSISSSGCVVDNRSTTQLNTERHLLSPWLRTLQQILDWWQNSRVSWLVLLESEQLHDILKALPLNCNYSVYYLLEWNRDPLLRDGYNNSTLMPPRPWICA